MGILRTDVISHSQLSNGNASVLFDGTADRLTIPSHNSFAFGTADWTVEGWFYFTSITGQQTLVGDTYGNTAGWYLYKQSNHRLGVYYSSIVVDGSATIETDRWYHFAFVRNSGMTRIYINGELDAEGADTTDATTTQYYIGDTATSSGEFFGNISNLRITRTAVYKDNFTVPKFKLKEIPGTILLCCQSSSSTTEATVSVPGTLTTGGDPTATAFGPGLKEDITDTGVVFDGVTTFDSQAYMVPPSGKTTERNRGRAVFLGGGNPQVTAISFTQIQSGGIAQNFGSLSERANQSLRGGSSATRGLSTHSANSPYTNTIEFITIATTADALDFGDMSGTSTTGATGTNDTRAVFWIGTNPSTNVIDFATIATTGNTSDFGDMLVGVRHIDTMNSSTRCVIPGGWTSGGVNTNVIQFITFATTGNAQDFGDVDYSGGARASGGFSSPTRGVFAGGADSPSDNAINIIHFVTLASTGNSTDFGDISAAKRIEGGGTSSHIRGIIAGSLSPAQINTIEFVTIATTGNSQDFGDLLSSRSQDGYVGALSDCHGGLS
jgi:hypothetical protein